MASEGGGRIRKAARAPNSEAPSASVIRYRSARPGDAETLTTVAMRAKAFWGYPDEWLKGWESQLTITPQSIMDRFVLIAESRSQAVAFVGLVSDRGHAEVDDLWVLPGWMRRGIGTELMLQAMARSRSIGVRSLTVVSDPNAQAFYERFGARQTGWSPSTPVGRRLPVLQIMLDEVKATTR